MVTTYFGVHFTNTLTEFWVTVRFGSLCVLGHCAFYHLFHIDFCISNCTYQHIAVRGSLYCYV